MENQQTRVARKFMERKYVRKNCNCRGSGSTQFPERAIQAIKNSTPIKN